ncbi:MAG: c-type cytochrome [Janthinobacterium lividum]
MRRPVELAVLGLLLSVTAAQADLDSYVQVEQGRYLAVVGDCQACHASAKGPLAGGRAIETPFGNINAANLTPDRDTGLGRWSAEDFWHALHDGHSVTDGHLYPAFPYNYYTKVTRADSDALFAFLHSVEPVSNPVDRNTLPWPFSMRASMVAWNAVNFTPGVFQPDPGRSVEFNRGAYLVEGLGHCGACHTPMNAIGGPRDSQHLQGNSIQNWFVPNLTNDSQAGLGSWSADDIVQYLQTGRTLHAAAAGPMGEVIAVSTSKMTAPDLHAMAVYLKERGAAGPTPPTPLPAGNAQMTEGEAVYADNCSACHARSGMGVAYLFPALAGAPSVRQADPGTTIRVIIAGAQVVSTPAAPTAPAMPSFGWHLSNEQIANVVTYLRNSWGNAAPAVGAAQVSKIREVVAAPGK